MEAAIPGWEAQPLSYTEVGGTESGERPPWWFHREDVVVGRGQDCFERAADAVARWVPFDLAWVDLLCPQAPPELGQTVAFASRQFGVWALNVCRVVYVVDERPENGPWRMGFGYGTIASHAVQGEERFIAIWDRNTDEVRFEIAKFSRPRHVLVRAAGPLTWWIQTRFTQDALQRVAEEVQ